MQRIILYEVQVERNTLSVSAASEPDVADMSVIACSMVDKLLSELSQFVPGLGSLSSVTNDSSPLVDDLTRGLLSTFDHKPSTKPYASSAVCFSSLISIVFLLELSN